MTTFAFLQRLTPRRCVEWFIFGNLSFLALDIGLAHAQNGFREREEWIPVAFSLTAAVLLIPMAVGIRAQWLGYLECIVAASSILVGVMGMVLHLRSAFFIERTLRNLVYSAPFVAPLAYVGVGLLLLLIRMEPAGSSALGSWIVILALGGFVGNFGLALLDHAANAFFHWTEWIPVCSSAFASTFLFIGLIRKDPRFARATAAVLCVQMGVGMAGFGLHVSANVHRSGATWLGRFIYGAPAFAPLLFVNLALLGALGLWADARPETR